MPTVSATRLRRSWWWWWFGDGSGYGGGDADECLITAGKTESVFIAT